MWHLQWMLLHHDIQKQSVARVNLQNLKDDTTVIDQTHAWEIKCIIFTNDAYKSKITTFLNDFMTARSILA